MIQVACNHRSTQKHGKDKYGHQRRRCILCGKTWIEKAPQALGDMRIPKEKAVMALRMLLEGTSQRTINRLTGLNRHTINRLLLTIGGRCQRFWKQRMRDINAADIQCDELWSFIGAKERVCEAMNLSPSWGDCYTFLAIERDSKLILAYHVGKRDGGSTREFVSKLRDAISGDCQITTDGFGSYTHYLPVALWDKNIRFAQLIKIFSSHQPREEARYSPPTIRGTIKSVVWGSPDEDRISTSHIERFNLSLRMGLRRFTRLSNAFSKSPKQHRAAIVLWLTAYNFCRKHQTLGTTPAVKAGLTDTVWSVERLLDELAAIG